MFCSSLFVFSYDTIFLSWLDFSCNFRMRGLLETWCQKGVYGTSTRTVVICRSEIPRKVWPMGNPGRRCFPRGLGLKMQDNSLAHLIALLVSSSGGGRIQKEALSHAPSFSLLSILRSPVQDLHLIVFLFLFFFSLSTYDIYHSIPNASNRSFSPC